MKKSVIIFIALLIGNVSVRAQEKGIFTDNRDNKTYNTVKIGNQIWMAENLAFKTAKGCWVYDDAPTPANNFGYLYDWETAMTVAPEGWHLPTVAEWNTLEKQMGDESTVGLRLKSRSGWQGDGNGDDKMGFSGLASGSRDKSGLYDKMGSYGYWWTASAEKKANAWYQMIFKTFDLLIEGYDFKKCGLSVRCIKDMSKTKIEKPQQGIKKVSNGVQVGYVDETGQQITPLIYEDAYENFREGFAGVKLNGKWGFIDKEGKLIIPCIYEEAYNFWEALAGVKKNGKWGFIDINNKEIIPIQYDDVKVFRDGYGQVKISEVWYKIDKSGKVSAR